jgi:hypothetical protein
MSPLPTVTFASSATQPRGDVRVRSAGKGNTSRSLNGEDAGEEAFGHSAQDDRRHGPASRIGTTAYDPLWNGPRLRPAFVAQVLGQVMMDGRQEALRLALPAYRGESAQIPHGSFFNDDV